MKKMFSNLLMAGMLVFGTSVMFSSCSKPCKDVVCENEGVEREDGDDCVCDCTTGYEGDLCQTEMRTKFLGTYNVSGTYSCGVSGSGQFPSTVLTVATSSAGVDRITMDFDGTLITATVSGSSLTIASQQTQGYTYTGSGSINGNNITVTLEEYDASVPETCTYTVTGPKQ